MRKLSLFLLRPDCGSKNFESFLKCYLIKHIVIDLIIILNNSRDRLKAKKMEILFWAWSDSLMHDAKKYTHITEWMLLTAYNL